MAAVVFALSPAEAIPGITDYLTSEGQKIHGLATHKLSEDQFDWLPEDLTQFLDDLKDRASQCGWSNNDSILEIPIDPADPMSDTENLIKITVRWALRESERLKKYTSIKQYNPPKTPTCYTIASWTTYLKQEKKAERLEESVHDWKVRIREPPTQSPSHGKPPWHQHDYLLDQNAIV